MQRALLLFNLPVPGDLPLICLCFMDQLATHQRKLRGKILRICQELYIKVSRSPEVAEIIMERQKLVLDRMIHLLAEGEVASVLEKVASWFADGEIDVSLVRYFITEVSLKTTGTIGGLVRDREYSDVARQL